MTKKEIKKNIENSFSLANMLNTAMGGHMESFKIVGTHLKDGGYIAYVWNLKENRLEWHAKNTDTHQGIRMLPNEVSEKLSEILSRTDFIIKKYVWFGE